MPNGLREDLQRIPFYHEYLVRADPAAVHREGVERAKGRGKGSWRTGSRRHDRYPYTPGETGNYPHRREARNWQGLEDDAGTVPA